LSRLTALSHAASLGALTFACALANPALAQQAPAPIFELDALTVTATRSENKVFDVPASVSVITRDKLDDRQADDLRILRDEPGVNPGGGARSAGQIPTIRGLQGPRIITTVDGARRNYHDGIHSPLLIDPDMIGQIDILRGPSSALYGGGGLGGVLALRTLEVDDILRPDQNWGGRVKTSYRSGNSALSGNLTGAARNHGLDVLGSVTLRDAGDIRMGDGNDLQNEDWLRSGLLKAGWSWNDLNRVEFSYSKFSDDLVTPSNPGGSPAFGLLQKLDREQDQLTGSYSFRDSERKWLDGKMSVYSTRLHFMTMPYVAGVTPTDVQTATSGFSVQNSTRFEMASWLQHRLTYGIDGYRDRARNRDNGVANSVTPDGRQTAAGLFFQDEITIAKDWTLTGAVRQDYYWLTSTGQTDSDNHHLSPKVTLAWQATPNLGLYGSYAEAFRAPTLNEAYGNLNTTRALFNFRANPGLKPETARTTEIGATLGFNDLFDKGDTLRIKASLFQEDVDDLINSTTVGRYTRAAPFTGTGLIFQSQNVAKGERKGAELVATYSIGSLDLGLAYSHLRSKDATTGAGLFSPPDKLAIGTRYRFGEHWAAWWNGQFVADQDYDATVFRQRDGYGLHDLGVSYDRDWYRVDFSITNLFDKAYATYQQSQTTTFTYEEGRSINLTLTARF